MEMMWTYKLAESTLQSKDVDSLSQLQELVKGADWLWIDCLEPDEEELLAIAGLLKKSKIVDIIKEKQLFSRYEKINAHLLITILLIRFKDRLETDPIYVFANEKTFITVRSSDSSKAISDTLKILQDCTLKVKSDTVSSFIISRLFHEVTNESINTIMALRGHIDKIEEKALAKPADKRISKTVFELKREISVLERTLWVQRELMLTLREGVMPTIQPSEMDTQILTHATNNISRELSLTSSYNSALDSILRLQDLGMIHRVERILIYLTIVTIIMNAILILWQVNILGT